MKTKEINIQRVSGRNTVSREDGRIVYDKIKQLWGQSDQITIDFANLLIASVSFMDEVFGHLALEYSPDELRAKLKFVNMSEFDRALLNDIVYSRIRQKKLSSKRRALLKRTPKRRLLLKRTQIKRSRGR